MKKHKMMWKDVLDNSSLSTDELLKRFNPKNKYDYVYLTAAEILELKMNYE